MVLDFVSTKVKCCSDNMILRTAAKAKSVGRAGICQTDWTASERYLFLLETAVLEYLASDH